MGDRTLQHGNLYQILLCSLDALGNGSGYFASLAQAPAYNSVLIADNDNGGEGERTATLGNLRHTVDSDQSVF